MKRPDCTCCERVLTCMNSGAPSPMLCTRCKEIWFGIEHFDPHNLGSEGFIACWVELCPTYPEAYAFNDLYIAADKRSDDGVDMLLLLCPHCASGWD